jgi:phosphatidylethanolamine-binding protein
VVDDFIPFFILDVSWSKHLSAELGNTIKPKKLQDAPAITLDGDPTSSFDEEACNSNATYLIALTDPDAPSRDDPKWSEFCHWIATGVPIKSSSSGGCHLKTEGTLKDVISYKPPGPPPKTGKHRYVFLIFAPANGTSLPLNVTKPSERKHWGTGEERHGVRDWAAENGLFPVGKADVTLFQSLWLMMSRGKLHLRTKQKAVGWLLGTYYSKRIFAVGKCGN